MAKRARYSVEEARRINLEMPDGCNSDDPEFSGGDGDIRGTLFKFVE